MAELTPREVEVVVALERFGWSIPIVSEKLFISRRTTSVHMDHIYRKLDISSGAGSMARLAYRVGKEREC